MMDRRREAFEVALRQHGAALRRLAMSHERDAARAEDLVQEIALAFWRALPRFRGDASLKTFLFRIAHNRAMSHAARGARRRDTPLGTGDAEIAVAEGADPESRLSEGQRLTRLRAAVRDLRPALRQVVVLRLEGLSHREIGKVLGLTENNVAVRLSRTRRRLREALTEPPDISAPTPASESAGPTAHPHHLEPGDSR